MTPENQADWYATRLGGRRIALALALAGCSPRVTGHTPAGTAWIADCPAPGCRRPDALQVTDTQTGTTIRCRGNCRDARTPLIYVHAAMRLTPATANVGAAA